MIKPLTAIAAAILALGIVQAAEKPMNVLVLLADDWRFDTLGVAGNPVVHTPHLDKLASQGIRFTNGCVTTSICGVSRASIMTGQWMSRHGNRGFKGFKTPWEETYIGILRGHGYHVGHVGKWHCGKINPANFDFVRSYNGRHWIEREGQAPIHVTAKNLEDAMAFLDTRPKDKPFLLNVNFFAPHAQDGHKDQYLPQPGSMKLYQDVTIPNPPLRSQSALENLPPFLQDERNEGRVRYHWRFDTEESYQRMMKNYYRLCSEVDATCGAIINRLRNEGLLDHTLVIFTGDNGYFHGDRLLADKWYPYQESIRVPFIIHDPRLPAGKQGFTNDEFVLNVDIAPTILEATGMTTPTGMQGRDFAPLYLTDSPPAWRQDFFYEHGTISNKHRIPASQSVVTKDTKFTWWPEWEYRELYDLKTDPLEQTNLAAKDDHRKQADAWLVKLQKMAEQAR